MKHKFFSIPVYSSEREESALNDFCNHHRVVNIEKQFIADGTKSCWAICVTWLAQEGELFKERGLLKSKKPKVDYKEVLNEEDFKCFSELRNLRSDIAQQEGVVVYNVFTNEQLATMVTKRLTTKAALLEIEGIGQKRVEKYAANFLKYIQESLG